MVFENYRQSVGDSVYIRPANTPIEYIAFHLLGFEKKEDGLEAIFAVNLCPHGSCENRDSDVTHLHLDLKDSNLGVKTVYENVSFALRGGNGNGIGVNYYFPEDAKISFQKKAK